MKESIREAIRTARNRMLSDLDWEVNEAILYVEAAARVLKKEPETIASMTIDQMKSWSNLSFTQALRYVFPNAPTAPLPNPKNKTVKLVLHRKIVEVPILLRKRKIVSGKLF